MGWDGGNGLFPIIVVAIFDCFCFFFRDDPRTDDALLGEQGSDVSPRFLIFINPFGDDIPGAGQSILLRCHALFRIDIGGSLGGKIHGFLYE